MPGNKPDRKKAKSKPALGDRDHNDEAERDLEALVFGGDASDMWDKAGHELSDNEDDDNQVFEDDVVTKEDGNDQLFFFDSGPTPVASEKDEEDESEQEVEQYESDAETEDTEESSEDELERLQRIQVDGYGYGRKPAWEDKDDFALQVSLVGTDRTKKLRETEDEDVVSGVEYEQKLRRQFEKVHPVPSWATLPSLRETRKRRSKVVDGSDSDYSDEEEQHSDFEDDDDVNMMRSTHGILDKRRAAKKLPPKDLSVIRLKNANQMSYSQATISTVQFHPNSQVMMTAGLDKTLRLFQIDGKVNHKIQSMYFEDMPIHRSAFHPDGDHIVATGRRKYYYIYDVQSGTVDKSKGIWGRDDKSLEQFSISPCGKYIAFLGRDGYIILVSFKTKQWIANLKMNGSVHSVDWSADGKYIWGIGIDGEVYQWDIAQRECVHKWMDDGAFKPSALAVSPNEDYYAVGSKSGIVNVYGREVLRTDVHKPTPLKALGNLTTRIQEVKFNHDSQLMGISSNRKRDQFRLVHLPSLTVFSNWPTAATPLSYVSSFDFSPRSGYLAIGNDKGRVLLYRLNHYPSA
ncbi:U3 snoRNP protein [Umbelopsis nana]